MIGVIDPTLVPFPLTEIIASIGQPSPEQYRETVRITAFSWCGPSRHCRRSRMIAGNFAGEAILCQRVQERAVDLVGRRKRQFVHEPDKARMRIGSGIGKRETLDVV